MNYQEALSYLDGLNIFGVRLGLSRYWNFWTFRRIATGRFM